MHVRALGQFGMPRGPKEAAGPEPVPRLVVILVAVAAEVKVAMVVAMGGRRVPHGGSAKSLGGRLVCPLSPQPVPEASAQILTLLSEHQNRNYIAKAVNLVSKSLTE